MNFLVCRDNLEMCGLYISVANISDMMLYQNQVDVIHTVLNVKNSLPQFLVDQVRSFGELIFRNLVLKLILLQVVLFFCITLMFFSYNNYCFVVS